MTRSTPPCLTNSGVKRGLRDKDGKGVLAGITNISRIDAFEQRDGRKFPVRANCGTAGTMCMI